MQQYRFYDKPVLARGRTIIGIDIGKDKHAAAAVSCEGVKTASLASFTNDKKGVDQLEMVVLAPSGGPTRLLFAMEATGHYWMALYAELGRRGYRGVVLNPIQTHGDARTRIRKTKTDKRDAESIARLILTGKAHATRITDNRVCELRVLVRQRHRLVQSKGNVERVAQSLTMRIFPEYERYFSKPFLLSIRALIRTVGLSPRDIVEQAEFVQEVLKRTSRGRLTDRVIEDFLECARTSIGTDKATTVINDRLRAMIEQIEDLELQIVEIEEELAKRDDIQGSPLHSLGIKDALVATIHAESDPISDFKNARQYAAYAGLDPTTYESGNMQGTRNHISKRGSPLLRNALYLTAFSIYRKHDCFYKAYRRFRKRGHPHRKALINVAHKIARTIFGMLRDKRQFTKRPPKKS